MVQPQPVPVCDVSHVGRKSAFMGRARPKWRVAVQTCIDAETGKATAADVCVVFEAAREAGFLRSL